MELRRREMTAQVRNKVQCVLCVVGCGLQNMLLLDRVGVLSSFTCLCLELFWPNLVHVVASHVHDRAGRR